MYKCLDKLNVKSNLPSHQISEYVPKKFRTSSDICKYDCSFEESFLASLNEKEEANLLEDHRKNSTISSSSSFSNISNNANARRRSSSALRNEEIMKSLAALKEELSEEGQITRNNSGGNTTNTTNTTTTRNNSAILRMKAETAAEMYLGVEDTGKFLRFLDFYVNLFEATSSINSSFEAIDAKIVKVFDLFDEDVKKSAEFLVISEELEELGFEEDKVVAALMLNSNDREAALDFLMKN